MQSGSELRSTDARVRREGIGQGIAMSFELGIPAGHAGAFYHKWML